MGHALVRGLALAAALLVPLATTPAPGAATIAAPGEGFAVLAEAAFSDLPPEPTFLGLVRLALPPGAAAPLAVGPGPTLVYAETDGVTATIAGSATVARAAPGAAPAATPAAGGEIGLRAGDAIATSDGAPIRFRNDGRSTAAVLLAIARPDDPFGPFPRTTWGGGRAELLVGRVVVATSGGPTRVVLARQSFDPGDGLEPAAAAGPALFFVEAGRMTYAVDSGDAEITRGLGAEERLPEPALPGAQTVLDPGDAVAETAGAASGGYAVGHVRVDLLALLLEPAAKTDREG